MDLSLILLITTLLTWLFSLCWTMCWGLIPPFLTLFLSIYLSYVVSKRAALPLLKEAQKIRRSIDKALDILPDDFVDKLKLKASGAKGGKVKSDPVGDWLSEKTGGLTDLFRRPQKKDEDRLHQIVEEEAQKAGYLWPKTKEEKQRESPTYIPVPSATK